MGAHEVMELGQERTKIIQAAVEGDEQAFAELTRIYASRLRWLVRLRLDPAMRARVSADDVLQEALLVASKHIRQFVLRDEPAFWAWLCRVVEHRLIDFHRRHIGSEKRDARREVSPVPSDHPLDGAFDPPAMDQSAPSERLRKQEQRELLELALEQLIPAHRDVIVLRVLEGQDTAQAAEILGRSPGAVSVLLHKAMQSLSKVLVARNIDLNLE